MKIGIFTDSHYSSQEITCGKRYNSRSLEKIKQAYRFFEEKQCDLVVCLGDLTDRELSHDKEIENLRSAANVIRSSSLCSVCLMGNHDAFSFTQTEFYEILGYEPQNSMEINGKTLLFMDTCYFKSGTHYMPGDSDWTDTFYPHAADLKKQLAAAPGDVYIFVHQNLDPAVRKDHRLYNADEINAILYDSKKVKKVFQGHYHPGNRSIHNGMEYLTFPAMCETEKAYFVEEI